MRTKPFIAIVSIFAACVLTLNSPASFAVAESGGSAGWDEDGRINYGGGGGDWGGWESAGLDFSPFENSPDYGAPYSGQVIDDPRFTGDVVSGHPGFAPEGEFSIAPADQVIAGLANTDDPARFDESAGLDLSRPEAPPEVASTNPADVDLGRYFESLRDQENVRGEQDSAFAAFDSGGSRGPSSVDHDYRDDRDSRDYDYRNEYDRESDSHETTR